jgi:multisubunit Na+/H+ antiporter MnhE subunit
VTWIVVTYLIVALVMWFALKTSPKSFEILLALVWPLTLLWVVKQVLQGEMEWTRR